MSFKIVEGEVSLKKRTGEELGTGTDPVRTDPTGTTTQPVSAASLPLPAGAATEATLATRATEATLATRATEATLSTRATEATLAAADTKLGTIDAVLDSIKDVDGIKKITDELPAGTQEIGAVKQGTPADATTPWWSRLTDGVAAIGSIVDNSIRRLETRATIAAQLLGAGAETKITAITDTEDTNQKRLQVEARNAPGFTVNIGTGIPADPASLVVEKLMNGGSGDMLVNGSVTPVTFSYGPSGTDIVAVQSLRLVFAAQDIAFNGSDFGVISTLTNGLVVESVVNSVTTEIFNIQLNEDFLRVPGSTPLVNNTGPKDVLVAAFGFGGLLKLDGSTSDVLQIRVRDNITSAGHEYFTATLFGAVEA